MSDTPEQAVIQAADYEDTAWTWMEGQFGSVEAGLAPQDRDYSADEMVDAFIAGIESRRLPEALREQACTISKTESAVTIDCDDPDLANDLFEWLSEGVCAQPLTEPASEGLREALEIAYGFAKLFNRRSDASWAEAEDRILAALAAQPLTEPQRLGQEGEAIRGNTICQECATRHPSYLPCSTPAQAEPVAWRGTIAKALKDADWAGVSIGNKNLIAAAIEALSTGQIALGEEVVAQSLYFDHVDQHGYPNGLPTWEELPEVWSSAMGHGKDYWLSLARAAHSPAPPQDREAVVEVMARAIDGGTWSIIDQWWPSRGTANYDDRVDDMRANSLARAQAALDAALPHFQRNASSVENAAQDATSVEGGQR